MADTAVRVDIVVGQNTVIRSLDLTEEALKRTNRTAAGTTTTFSSLSESGLKKVENGFKALAFQAAGVPGPLGKIAEGAILLGGGGGVLLGVAAAAGALGLAWVSLTGLTKQATAALAAVTAELDSAAGGMLKLATLTEEFNKHQRQTIADSWLLSKTPLGVFLPWLNKQREDEAATMAIAIQRYRALLQRQAEEKKNREDEIQQRKALLELKKQEDLAYRIGMALAGAPQLAPRRTGANNAMAWDYVAPKTGLLGAETPDKNSLSDIERAEFLKVEEQRAVFLETSAQFTADLNAILVGGFMDLGVGLAEALSGNKSFGEVITAAFGQMMQDIGRLMIQFGVQLTILKPLLSNLFLAGPAMIAAGIILSAAGAAVSKRAQGQQVSSSVARGGVDSGRYESDQANASRGTVTVTMKGGFINPRDPAFQEFLAEVFKEAKGRNVVFA